MTDSSQDFQPSESSPEAPLRTQMPNQPQPAQDTQVAQQQAEAAPGTSGIDVAGEVMAETPVSPMPSSELTESFAAARSGDTATMPTVANAAISQQPSPAEKVAAQAQASAGAYASTQPGTSASASDYRQQQSAPSVAPGGIYAPVPSSNGYGSQATSAPTPVQGYSRQQSAAAAGLESGYASQSSSQGYTSYAQRAQAANAAASASQVPASAVTRQAKPKQSSGAGKTFLFGFLGALLACLLAFGGFAFAGGFNTQPAATGSSAVIGSANQSVINAADEGQTLAEAVAAKALPSVVAIYNYQNQSSSYGYGFGYGYGASNQGDDSLVATGMGSGVVISDDGYIITNYHVVEDAAKLTVSVNGVERDATYVGGDSSSDIAVVKVEDTDGLVSADIGDSDSLRIGEWVMTVGAPLGLESSVATGVVSATNRSTIMDSSSNSSDLYSYFYGNQTPEYTYYPNMIQTDAVINPGNSGGALVDADGKLIGINAMISSYSGDYAGVGFAIPINYAISLAQDIIDGKEPTHAIMGVSLSQVNSMVAQQYNLSADSGAYVSAITEGTGAADSDLQIGDIITKVDGKAVASPTEVTLEVRAHKVGDTIAVTVNRNGETMDIDVVLGSDEDASASSSQGSGQGQQDGEQQDQNMDQSPFGNGRGDGQGGGGYSRDELEELLKMLGY